MYAITIVPPCGVGEVIERRMSSNNRIELIPVLKGMCVVEYGMVDPLALPLGGGVYRIFEQAKPWMYAQVTIVKEDT